MHLAGVSAHPQSAWVNQHARNLAIDGRLATARFLVCDRDAEYAGPFLEVFASEGVRVIRTPARSPKANAFAERWVFVSTGLGLVGRRPQSNGVRQRQQHAQLRLLDGGMSEGQWSVAGAAPYSSSLT